MLDKPRIKSGTASGSEAPFRSSSYVNLGGNTDWDYEWNNASNALNTSATYATIDSSNCELFVKLAKDGDNTYTTGKNYIFT